MVQDAKKKKVENKQMSRRRAASKREVLPDPKFHSVLISNFVNHVMKSGKKSIAEKIVYGALEIASQKLENKGVSIQKNIEKRTKELKKTKGKEQKFESDEDSTGTDSGKPGVLVIFDRALENISPTVEVKSRRIGGATFQVPVEVRPSRRLTLAMRWLIEASKKRGEKNMMLRLAGEIIDAFSKRGTAVKKREDTHKMAKANQAFAHYHW